MTDDKNLLVIIPAVLGLMMFSRLTRRRGYLARIPLALLIGAGAGVSIPAMLWARILKQMSASMLPLFTVSGIIIFVGVITTFAYFYFSREQTGWFGYIAKTGTYFLMVFFNRVVQWCNTRELVSRVNISAFSQKQFRYIFMTAHCCSM